jgi:hypothetical protein
MGLFQGRPLAHRIPPIPVSSDTMEEAMGEKADQ